MKWSTKRAFFASEYDAGRPVRHAEEKRGWAFRKRSVRRFLRRSAQRNRRKYPFQVLVLHRSRREVRRVREGRRLEWNGSRTDRQRTSSTVAVLSLIQFYCCAEWAKKVSCCIAGCNFVSYVSFYRNFSVKKLTKFPERCM